MPLQPVPGDVAAILDRAAGRFGLDDSFSWWLEAVKAERSPQADRLRDEIAQLFKTHWTPRVNRAAVVAEVDGVRCWVTNGFPIFAGSYSVGAGRLPLRLRRDDGTVLAEGTTITGSLDTTEFGVRAEVEIGDGEGATVEVDQRPRSG
jgi:hypothetical protein